MGLGVLLLAVAFAFQDIASSFFAGLLITVRQPFQVGDLIETNGVMGTASEMNLRTTELRTFEGTTVRIPNKRIFQAPLVNYTQLGKRRVHIEGAVALETDAPAAREAGIAAVSRLSLRDPDREVEFYWNRFTGNGMAFSIYCWIDFQKEHDYRIARSEAIVAIRSAFNDAGIVMVALPAPPAAVKQG
jgi:small conductance mechanosensitive channel